MYQVLLMSSSWFASVALFLLSFWVANASLFINNDVGEVERVLGKWLLHQSREVDTPYHFKGLIALKSVCQALEICSFTQCLFLDFQWLITWFWAEDHARRIIYKLIFSSTIIQIISSRDLIIIRQILTISKILSYKESSYHLNI